MWLLRKYDILIAFLPPLTPDKMEGNAPLRLPLYPLRFLGFWWNVRIQEKLLWQYGSQTGGPTARQLFLL